MTTTAPAAAAKEEMVSDVNFDRKFDLATEGVREYIKEHLRTKITKENCATIITYMLDMQTEVSPSQTHRTNTIYKLKQLAEFHNPKAFKDMTRQDIIDFLDHFRKPESVDPMHKWIGTYNASRVILIRFYRWLYFRRTTPHSKRPKPEVIDNIPTIKRREISTYKPTDLWTEEDDVLFYKYVPSLRDRCWHAVARDTGCRPSEMIKIKIKDVIVQQLESGHHIARIPVNGKTGVQNKRINNGYPILKEWLTVGHPYPNNPNAYLFCGTGTKNNGRQIATSNTMYVVYDKYKKEVFPKLLQDPLVPEEDKRHIRDLLKKRWNPHNRRHTAGTEISKAIKDPVLVNQYMGWSQKGNTRLKYQHYFADDAFEAMITVVDGLTLPDSKIDKDGKKKRSPLKPKQCPNCDETNKTESKFCVKCKFVLSFDAFNEALEEKDKSARDLAKAKTDIEQMKTAIEKHDNKVSLLLDLLKTVNNNEVDNSREEKKRFILERLGVLTNGEIGEDPESGIVTEPV
jgi:integrase/recombinase XerD